jgi:uncharacterized phage protein (TIGR01671 family)
MREIFFRGKRKDTGEWVYGFYVKSKAFEYIHRYDRGELSDRVFTCYNIIPETVGQYTGLKDKDGKRIFEGDIVKTNYAGIEHIGVIGFSEYEIIADFKKTMGEVEIKAIFRQFSTLKIIGTIHDTPELLEAGREDYLIRRNV